MPYLRAMARKLYNLPLLTDNRAFSAFLDAYATSLDVDPLCGRPRVNKSAEALWEDFVRISTDANNAFSRNVKESLRRTKTAKVPPPATITPDELRQIPEEPRGARR